MPRVVPAVVVIFEAAAAAGDVDGATTAVTGGVIGILISETGAMVLPTATSGVENGNAIGATETAFEVDDHRPGEGRHR